MASRQPGDLSEVVGQAVEPLPAGVAPHLLPTRRYGPAVRNIIGPARRWQVAGPGRGGPARDPSPSRSNFVVERLTPAGLASTSPPAWRPVWGHPEGPGPGANTSRDMRKTVALTRPGPELGRRRADAPRDWQSADAPPGTPRGPAPNSFWSA